MKNLIIVFLGVALAISGIAYLQTDRMNRRLAEQLRQAEEKAKIAEADAASLRKDLQALKDTIPTSPPPSAGQTLPSATPEQAGSKPEVTEEVSSSQIPTEIINQHVALIRTRVERAWRIPEGIPRHLGCILKIELMPNGEVQSVRIINSSGNADFDRSAVAAVQRASPFPMPTIPEVAARFKSFNFRFKPGG